MAASMGRIVGRNCPSAVINLQDLGFLVQHHAAPLYNVTPVMYMRSKHYAEKFKTDRRYKIIFHDKHELYKETVLDPDSQEYKEEKEKKFKSNKERPENYYQVRKTFIDSVGVQDPFVPKEGDGKVSLLKKQGMKDEAERLTKKAAARIQAVRKIKKYEDNFSVKAVIPELLQVYIDSHNLITDFQKNELLLRDLITPTCYEKMVQHLDRMTLRWKFIENIEPPKGVHVVCGKGPVEGLFYGQITVRIHSKQIIALYDQFGRLVYGHPKTPVDVLDFIVFEKNLVDLYGKWRMIDKNTPDWLPVRHKHKTIYLKDDIKTKESTVASD
ncbi:39S ribosomal protein L45 [Mactra antiquata]